MRRQLTVEISETSFAVLERRAASSGSSPASVAAATLESQLSLGDVPAGATPPRSLETLFGSIGGDSGTDSGNLSIDADLARQFGDER